MTPVPTAGSRGDAAHGMPQGFDTAAIDPPDRSRAWAAAIDRSYFPLTLRYRDPGRFSGRLAAWTLGALSVSRLQSDALSYRREARHLRGAEEEDFLVTVPGTAPVQFTQMGRSVDCRPGGFVLERGNEPYRFSYAARSDLIAVKVSATTLKRHLPRPGRFCAIDFDARDGVGALMVDMLRATEARWAAATPAACETLGRQLLEMLALAVEGDARVLQSRCGAIRAAHLDRIARVVAARFADPDLSPGEVARVCGISTRHLHTVCHGDGATFGERLRAARLTAARERLRRYQGGRTITEIAFASGFSDAASFSRAYRAAFGETPSQTRAGRRRDACRPGLG